MRRAVLFAMLLIGLFLMGPGLVHAAGFPCGRCCVSYYGCGYYYAPCCMPTNCCVQYRTCCPVVCCVPVRQPACCQPTCCGPATQQKVATPTKKDEGPTPTLAPAEPVKKTPTLAPAEPVKETAPELPSLDVKDSKPASKPEAKPAKNEGSILPLSAKSPLPSKSLNAPKAAEGDRIPGEDPLKKSSPKTKPVDKPSIAPSEKPLVAFDDNPFIIETDQLQIWTDASGSYRVEARFVSFHDETVRLQRPNGQYVRIAMDRLSKADRERVRDLSLALAMQTSMK